MSRFISAFAVWTFLNFLIGCGDSSTHAVVDTGSKQTTRQFCEAIQHRDWAKAYALLHPDSAKAMSAQEFTRRATQFRLRLGFEPTRLAIRTCEEVREKAIAKFVFTGSGGTRHTYEDNLFLMRHDNHWLVTVSNRFGQ